MAAVVTKFTCDSPGCRSVCELHPTDAKAENVISALAERGWYVQGQENDPKKGVVTHCFCPVHVPSLVSTEDDGEPD